MMGALRPTVCITATILSAATSALQGQDRDSPRQGLWFSSGIGPGWALQQRGTSDAALGKAGYTRIGGTLRAKLRVGGELTYWLRSSEDLQTHRGNLTVSSLYYPLEAASVFLKTGVGLAITSADYELWPGLIATDNSAALGITVGIGVDIAVSRTVAVTTNTDWLRTIAYASDTHRYSILLVTLGFTFQRL